MPPFSLDDYMKHYQLGWQKAHQEHNAQADQEAEDVRKQMLKHELASYTWKDKAEQLHNQAQELENRKNVLAQLTQPHPLIPDLNAPPETVPGTGQATLPSEDPTQGQDQAQYAMNMPPPMTHATATIPAAPLSGIPEQKMTVPTPEEAATSAEMPLQPGAIALLESMGIHVPPGTKLTPANQERLFNQAILAQQKSDNAPSKLQSVAPGGVLIDPTTKKVVFSNPKPDAETGKVHVVPGFTDENGNPIVATDKQLQDYAAGNTANNPLLKAHTKGSEKLDAQEKKTLDTINSSVPIMKELLKQIAPGVNPDNALTDEGLQQELAKTQKIDNSIGGKASALVQGGKGKIGFGYGPGWDTLIPQTEHINVLATSPYLQGSRNYNLIQDVRKFLPSPTATKQRQVQDMLNFINTTAKIKAGQNLGKGAPPTTNQSDPLGIL